LIYAREYSIVKPHPNLKEMADGIFDTGRKNISRRRERVARFAGKIQHGAGRHSAAGV
jgi:hypothetical protein